MNYGGGNGKAEAFHAGRGPQNVDPTLLGRPSPKSTQVGGSHYKDMPIQPVEYIVANKLGYVEGAVVKYVSRWQAKGGVEDLKKARHFLDLYIEQLEDTEQA